MEFIGIWPARMLILLAMVTSMTAQAAEIKQAKNKEKFTSWMRFDPVDADTITDHIAHNEYVLSDDPACIKELGPRLKLLKANLPLITPKIDAFFQQKKIVLVQPED